MVQNGSAGPTCDEGGRADPLVQQAARRTRLGFGASGIARSSVDEDTAFAALQSAWDHGLRWFDVAPMYGDGLAERLLGQFLRDKPRGEYVLSTKVGRLVRPDLARVAGLLPGWIYDFTAAGVARSLDESLTRLGLDHVDVLLAHDPEGREQLIAGETWPRMVRLRDEGVIGAAGIGMQLTAEMTRFVERLDLDVLLIAGRYTLLDPEAAEELLPAAARRGVRVMAAEALHGGLARGATHPHFNYRPVPGVIRERVARLADTCDRHGVPLEAVALQFPLAHPSVDLLLTGPQTAAQLDQNVSWLATPVPAELWAELRAGGLIPPHVPTPTAAAP
jgi:D-threo-aldose 1-dehydrogenase